MSQGAFYTGFSDVVGGRLTFNNQMIPNLTTPAAVQPSAANYGHIYAQEYDNLDLLASLMVRQRTDAATVSDSDWTTGSQSTPEPFVKAGMKLGFKDPVGGNPVVFTMAGLSPDLDQTVSAGIGEEERTYTNFPSGATAVDASSLSIGIGTS
jgi:hypothetical protein